MGTLKFTRATSTACGVVILASTLSAVPAAATSQEPAVRNELTVNVATVTAPSLSPGFEECESTGLTASETSLGSELGAGASELLTEATRATINASLLSAGRAPLNDSTQALRHMNDGAIYEVDASGAEVSQLSTSALAAVDKDATASTDALLHPEVKRIIGACLGFGGAGGMGFEALVRYLGNPVNAAKFVIRRIGIAGAISCVGGVIWEYI